MTRASLRRCVARGPGVVEQLETAWRQYQLCAHTFEQCQAELFFQRGDLSAQRGLRAVQSARRG